MKTWHLFAAVAAILLMIASCGPKELHSRARDREIAIDGAYEDWQGALEFVEDANLSVGLMNDGEFLYVALVAGDRMVRRQIMMSGLYLWFDQDGNESKRFGIRYPIGLQENAADPDSMMREPNPEKMRTQFQDEVKEMMVIGHDDRTWRRAETGAVRGIEVAAGGDRHMLVLEYKVPIGRTGQYGYGIGSEPGAVIGVGLETPEIDFKEMRRQRPGGGMPGGGMPGGGTPAGGMPGSDFPGGGMPDGGQRPERPEPIKLWAKVELAATWATD
jgi:hypothetical protein